MRPFSLGSLQETQNHLRSEFSDFAIQWQATKSQWRDEPAKQFEQRYLNGLAPTMTRVSAAATDLADLIRAADRRLDDPERVT